MQLWDATVCERERDARAEGHVASRSHGSSQEEAAAAMGPDREAAGAELPAGAAGEGEDRHVERASFTF